jgi:hypothetical protein
MTTTAEALRAAVDAVVGQDLEQLSAVQLQALVALAEPQAQRLSGLASLAGAVLSQRVGGRLPTEDGRSRSVAGWVAEQTASSPEAAGRSIRLAGLLREGLPAVAQAVLDGTVGLAQAEVLTRLVGNAAPSTLAEAEASLIVAATSFDPPGLAAYVRHLLATWVEPRVDDDEASAVERRYLKTRREADGALWGSFRLAGGDAESVLTALEPAARRQGLDDSRSAAQRRADALVDVCEQVLRHGDLPDAGGQRPQLTYVLPADWAARRAERDTCPACRTCPAHAPVSFAALVEAGIPSDHRGPGSPVPAEHACAVAAWTGPQTRARIETMLCDARVSRLLLDEVGQVQGLEAVADQITPRQRRALAARDLTCVARGCTRPPALCDAHHLVARKDGGATTLGNLVLLCRRHHVLWHLGKIDTSHLHVPWLRDPRDMGPPGAPTDLLRASA